MYSWIIPLGGVDNLDFAIPLAITRLRDKHTMRDSDSQLIAESWNGEFKTPEIVTEIDKIEFLAGLDITDDNGVWETLMTRRFDSRKESQDRRRRRTHRALTRFTEQERGIIAKGSGLWKVDASCEEMKGLLDYFEDLLEKDRDGDRYGQHEKYVDLVFDRPELVMEDRHADAISDWMFESRKHSLKGVEDTPADFLTFGSLDERSRSWRKLHKALSTDVDWGDISDGTIAPSRGELLPESLSEEVMEIMAKICGTEGSAHITEIHDRVSLIGDYSKDDVDGAIALLLSSESITKIGDEEYKIKNDSGRKAAVAFEEYRRRKHQMSFQWLQYPTAELEVSETDMSVFDSETSDPASEGVPADLFEDLALETRRLEKLFEMKIGTQLQSAFEEEVKKEHWPMKSMKQKAKGEVPTVKWKIHELVMNILWSNYRAESDEATLESGESEDSQYKAPGYLPTSHITSSLKSKYGVEKSEGRISQVLGDLCGLGVLTSEKVEGGRGKKYKLTTKGKVMMKSAEKAMRAADPTLHHAFA